LPRQDAMNEKLQTAAMVYLVGAGPGDPGLITVRGVECLQMAQAVVCDRLVSRVLRRYAPDAEWIDVGKQPDHHPVPQADINRMLVEQARAGRVVVRLKGGDPFVFGRGGEEAQALVDAGIPFEVVPGVTSAVAVPAYAGIPVTQRGLTTSLAVITGHRSQDITDGLATLDCAAMSAGTRVFLMGVNNLPGLVARMIESGCSPETPAAIIEQGTTPHQKVRVGTLADIVERAADIRPPAITVVGEVVRLRQQLAWFEDLQRRPLLGLCILNTRPSDAGDPRQARGVDDFSRRLAALGAETLDLPATRLLPSVEGGDLDAAIRHMAGCGRDEAGENRVSHPGCTFDWVLFTSANAVRFFFARLCSLGYDARILSGARLGTVGSATVSALAEQHLRTDFVPRRYTGLDWAMEAPALEGKRILLPRSEIADEALLHALQQRGARVEAVTAYRVAAATPEPQALQSLMDGQVDVVALFSPSALRGLLAMLEGQRPPGTIQPPGDWAAAILNRQAVACVGPTTAQAAQQLGVRVDVTAQPFTADGLVEALVQWRGR
jgi:uroporphyrinogen III methyltransferase / synthase